MSTPADQRPLTPTEADAAIALLRAGGTAVIEAGRAGWSLHFKDESFHVDEWEEQDNSTSKVSEEFVRSTLAKHPAAFHRLLLKAPWEAFRRAFVADNRPVARELLQRTREHGDEHFDFLDAFLGWPQEKPSPEAVAQIARRMAYGARKAYEAVFGPLAYGRQPDPATAEVCMRGVGFFDALNELAGGPGGHWWARAEYHCSAGRTREAFDDFRRAMADPRCLAQYESQNFPRWTAQLMHELGIEEGHPDWVDCESLARALYRGP